MESSFRGEFESARENSCVMSSVALKGALTSLGKITQGLSQLGLGDLSFFFFHRKPALGTEGTEFERYWHSPGRVCRMRRCCRVALWEVEDTVLL